MTNRDLLKEAIADAKAIKETAIANAKAALEESFTPHLMSRLAAKINEMDSYYEEDDTLEEVNDELEEMKDEMKEYAEEQPSRDMDGDGDVDANDVKMMKEFNSEEEMEEIDLSNYSTNIEDYADIDEENKEVEIDLDEIKNSINSAIGETLSKYFK